MNEEEINFTLCTQHDVDLMKKWWNKPYVMEFWDNSPEMWENYVNFTRGKKDIFDYWLGSYQQQPFCLVMTSLIEPVIDPDAAYPIDHMIPWLVPKGQNLGFDFMIGEEAYLGKGLSYRALRRFIRTLGASADAFFIDPATNNSKALHIYKKAGFEVVSTFISKSGSNKGLPHYLMRASNLQCIQKPHDFIIMENR